MSVAIDPSWKALLHEEFDKQYFRDLIQFVKHEYKSKRIYPEGKDIFRAFDLTPVQNVKVVILGQDPYHTPGVANGLAFSVHKGQKIPPSLNNIYKELNSDLGKDIPTHGDLTQWSRQGVLLINSTLTVEEGKAGSHQNKGWETFTDAAIQSLSKKNSKLVFILWGAFAQKKAEFIDEADHLVLRSAHPSPLSAHRGFFGSKPFSKTNDYLISIGESPIEW